MVMFKPSVIRHPVTGERSLMIHIFTSWPVTACGLLIDAFLPDYSGWQVVNSSTLLEVSVDSSFRKPSAHVPKVCA